MILNSTSTTQLAAVNGNRDQSHPYESRELVCHLSCVSICSVARPTIWLGRGRVRRMCLFVFCMRVKKFDQLLFVTGINTTHDIGVGSKVPPTVHDSVMTPRMRGWEYVRTDFVDLGQCKARRQNVCGAGFAGGKWFVNISQKSRQISEKKLGKGRYHKISHGKRKSTPQIKYSTLKCHGAFVPFVPPRSLLCLQPHPTNIQLIRTNTHPLNSPIQ